MPNAPEGMVLIPAGVLRMGSDALEVRADERPAHDVPVRSFRIDRTEVTNAEFARFVEATGYVTTAERKPEWEELRKQLPPGTPKPPEEDLVPGSLVFTPSTEPVPLDDPSRWWVFTKGASWRHPEGLSSDLRGRERYPVVHVSHDDARAYAAWAKKRLPTEAEWEWAARGGLAGTTFSWGDGPLTPRLANVWQGRFPFEDLAEDGFRGAAPAGSYPPNGYGLFDTAGNLWEWCADWYRADTYVGRARPASGTPPIGAEGPTTSLDPDEPAAAKRVLRGGSFLCNAVYCSGYRVSARMKSTPDTSSNHIGFRCVSDP